MLRGSGEIWEDADPETAASTLHSSYFSDYMAGRGGRPKGAEQVDTMAPPWRIYPLQPAQCAGLIADVLVFTVTLSSDNFVEELRKQGLDALGPTERSRDGARPARQIIKGHGRQVTMARAGVEHLMLVLTGLQVWARGMEQLLRKGVAGWQPWPYFTDECKVCCGARPNRRRIMPIKRCQKVSVQELEEH
ncbi:hypothetical protein [Streptomyces canus]|uniref:hypothetical protein n=1 Tax=Streptomyces canus TaxID=58343 RepID=UPI0022569DCB|nr:hypothetical protein [Streptomyces canus]MCX4862111.1 hypothetical protein [Streptomyces canus]